MIFIAASIFNRTTQNFFFSLCTTLIFLFHFNILSVPLVGWLTCEILLTFYFLLFFLYFLILCLSAFAEIIFLFFTYLLASSTIYQSTQQIEDWRKFIQRMGKERILFNNNIINFFIFFFYTLEKKETVSKSILLSGVWVGRSYTWIIRLLLLPYAPPIIWSNAFTRTDEKKKATTLMEELLLTLSRSISHWRAPRDFLAFLRMKNFFFFSFPFTKKTKKNEMTLECYKPRLPK